MPFKTQVCIVSWTGKHDAALAIESQLVGRWPDTTVIWSDRDDSHVRPSHWLRVPDADFFGAKFARMLGRFDADMLFLITADTRCPDWSVVVETCEEDFARMPALGVWSPVVNFSPWQLGLVSLGKVPGTRLHKVVQTDSIVWGMSRRVVDRLRRLDYAQNNLGWGIDTAACMFCHANSLLPVMDPQVDITHPRGTAYDAELADRQFQRFLQQLSPDEMRIAVEMRKRIDAAPKTPPKPGRNDPCPCGSGRKFKQCCGRA